MSLRNGARITGLICGLAAAVFSAALTLQAGRPAKAGRYDGIGSQSTGRPANRLRQGYGGPPIQPSPKATANPPKLQRRRKLDAKAEAGRYDGVRAPNEPASQGDSYDVIVRGGTIYDGTGAPGRRADVAVRGDAIAAVGDLGGASARVAIDASGQAVAPGFIDMHSHSDYSLLVDGRGLSKAMQGVTTELLGESGSAAPAVGPVRSEMERSLADLQLTLDWTTMGEYFRRLERQGVSVNLLSTVASGSVRAAVVGYDNRRPTPDELRKMESLIDEAMRDGAVGLSSGLIYDPNRYASTEELIALAKVAARYNGIYASHLRSEADGLLDAVKEAIRIGREAGLKVEIFHFKHSTLLSEGGGAGPTIQQAAALIEQAQRDGVKVYADVYPYAASQTGLSQQIPAWVREGGTEKMLARLRDAGSREDVLQEVRARLRKGIPGSTPETVMLGRTSHVAHREYLGKRLSEIATLMKVEPADAIIELLEKSGGQASAIYFGIREEDVVYTLALPWTTIGSDGSALAPEGILARSHPHPRSYGTFPRVLGRYVREQKRLTLEQAIRKMSGLAAERLGLGDRGLLAAGRKADIVVFDPATITDHADFMNPHQLATGVKWLVVNGEVVVADGRHTGAKPGRVLRRGSRHD